MFYRRPINGKVTRYRSFLVQPSSSFSKLLFTDLKFGYQYKQGSSIYSDVSTNNISAAVAAGSPGLVSGGVLDSHSLGNLNTSGCLFLPYSNNTSFGNKSFTLAMLFKFTLSANVGYLFNALVAKDQYQSSQREFLLYLQKSSILEICYLLGQGNSNQITVDTEVTGFNFSAWHLVILEYDLAANISRLYLDNNLIKSHTPSFTLGTYNSPLFLGNRRINNSEFDSYANWTNIQYIYKWDRVLLQSEKDYLYNSGSFRFLI
jgi:hypothetical protein